ncbi:MAG: hypothetical protein LUB61_06905 [Eggerthellaceae bacterium]|nr:hypothetical protein [Eggerthellaceae bacterium]
MPPEVVNDKEGLDLLSFPYIMNGGTFDDDLFQHMKASDFYDSMKKGAEPTTSQVPITV